MSRPDALSDNDLMYHDSFPGSVAALASHLSNNNNAQVQLAIMMDAVAAANCNSHCQSGGNGNGVVIGTAPFCDAHCSSDCPNTQCFSPWPANCWTGHKICCCASKQICILF